MISSLLIVIASDNLILQFYQTVFYKSTYFSNKNYDLRIYKFCEKNNSIVDRWIEETISGARSVEERKLGKLLKKMKKGDILICSELSRLGRNLLMIMGT